MNSNGLIVHRTNRARGRKHDLDIYKDAHWSLPTMVQRVFDLGYKGVMRESPSLNCLHPFKRRGHGGRGHRGEKAGALP